MIISSFCKKTEKRFFTVFWGVCVLNIIIEIVIKIVVFFIFIIWISFITFIFRISRIRSPIYHIRKSVRNGFY